MNELSLIELESELSALLPSRELMCARRRCRAKRHYAHRGGNGTSANNGSVANSNSTSQTINNSQTAVVTGVNGTGALQGNGALVAQVGANQNSNSNLQFGAPVNYQG